MGSDFGGLTPVTIYEENWNRCACCLLARQGSSPVQPSGLLVSSNRYCIISATVEIIGKSATIESKTLIRIDTWTGKTWEYTPINLSAQQPSYWSPIMEQPEFAARETAKKQQ
jgi:hypothetical protein